MACFIMYVCAGLLCLCATREILSVVTFFVCACVYPRHEAVSKANVSRCVGRGFGESLGMDWTSAGVVLLWVRVDDKNGGLRG
jgi:hypothetical protein